MNPTLFTVTYEAADPAAQSRFWSGMLGRAVVSDREGVVLPGDGAQVGLRFVPGRGGSVGENRMHLHLTSADLEDQRRTVAMAIRLGGRHVDVGQRPEDGHVVLLDPAGYEFCVIEPDNGYLAGCGTLGEVTCAGSRDVGGFWSEALGWPVVWDQGDQIAIQSPQGGTKIGWDTWHALAPRSEPDRQRFELEAVDGDLPATIAWLGSLGARLHHPLDDDTTVMADPDGNEFHVRSRGRSRAR